jgi:hypothetical protein
VNVVERIGEGCAAGRPHSPGEGARDGLPIELGVEILRFDRPVAPQASFYAGANRPPAFGLGERRDLRRSIRRLVNGGSEKVCLKSIRNAAKPPVT